MEYFECKWPEEPTLLFDERGFRFFLGSQSWSFYPHLGIDFSEPARPMIQVYERDLGMQHPTLVPGKSLLGIDRCLSHPERLFTFGQSLSEVLSLYFTKVHEKMGGAFKKSPHLNVLRPVLLSREPSLEGLAVVRLKAALFRAGFPEKQRYSTLFQDIPESEGNLLFLTDSFSQFRHNQKEVGVARGFYDQEMIALPEPEKIYRNEKNIALTNALLEEARTSLEVRSQLFFLKDWKYLEKLHRRECEFLGSPSSFIRGEFPTTENSAAGVLAAFQPEKHPKENTSLHFQMKWQELGDQSETKLRLLRFI